MSGCDEAVMTGDVCTFMGVRFTHSCTCSLKGTNCSKFGTIETEESYVDILRELMERYKFSQILISGQLNACERGTFTKQDLIDLIQRGRFDDKLSPEYTSEVLERLKSAN